MTGFRTVSIVGLFAILCGLLAPSAQAKPEYAKKEGKKCKFCHTAAPERNFRGLYYAAHNHSLADFDEEFESKAAGVKPESIGADAKASHPNYPEVQVPTALNFTLKDIEGKPVKLARYQEDVILVVNVASKCGYTPQYKSLQALYEKYKEKGFTVLGFPANEFKQQEPGTNEEIKAFCKEKYNVSFPLFSKIVVKGDNIAPLYKFLTDKEKNKKTGGDIKWNFTKFLINRKGEVVARFESKVDPASEEFTKKVEKLLEEPKE